MARQRHVIVLGLGITGSAIAAALAEHGYVVTAIEQFAPLHERGSSHGDTRIYRRAPFEGEPYISLAAASLEGWRDWNGRAGEPLFLPCGGLDAGPEHSPLVQSAEALCRAHGLSHEILTGRELNRRFAYYRVPARWHAVYQPLSGVLRPDATRQFLQNAACRAGARLLHGTRAIEIGPLPHGVRVRTTTESIDGDVLIVAAGSWLPKLLPELNLELNIERRVMAWFKPANDVKMPLNGEFPLFCFDADGGWYGIPTPDGRIKMGHDKHFGQTIDPDQGSWAPDDADAAFLASCAQRYFHGITSNADDMKRCIYTLTRDHHFIIDHHPQSDRVFIFACCSGHGFKYAPAYGKIALDLVEDKPRPDLESLRLNRGQARAISFGA